MLTLNAHNIISLGMPIEGREFTRYFSGYAITHRDQEVIVYHKKQFSKKQRKDIGSGQEVFLCRSKEIAGDIFSSFAAICKEHGNLMIRDNEILGMQVHIPITGDRIGKEEEYAAMANDLWNQGYVVVHSLIQTKDFPLVQRSITDPALLSLIAEGKDNADALPINARVRRDEIVQKLIDWCEENGYNTEMFDEYDIALIKCDA